MAVDCIFGNGAKITIGGSWSYGIIQSFEGIQMSVEVADVTPLSAGDDEYREKKFSKLRDHQSFAVEVYFDADQAPPSLGTVQKIVITYPGDDAKTLTGEGAIVEWQSGQMVSDEIATATFTLQFRGGATTAIQHA